MVTYSEKKIVTYYISIYVHITIMNKKIRTYNIVSSQVVKGKENQNKV